MVLLGALSWSQAGDVIDELLPTVTFLALILLFAHLCAQEGVSGYLAARAGGG